MSKKRALGYLRVSTKQQVDKFGFPTQRKMITEYAEKNGIEIVDWFQESYTGYSEERPQMEQILQGEYDVDYLIVAKSDRFARNIDYYYALKLQLSRLGIELVSAFEDFGQMGMMKPVMEAFVASFAEIERLMINQRTAGGREIKRKHGGYCGGRPPYGYNVENKALVINEDQAKVVRTIFEFKKAGRTLRTICSELTRLECKTADGGDFAVSSVKKILDNEPLYRGMYRYGKDTEWVQGQQEPILESEYRW